jgi:hypothetical protein
MPSVDRRSDPAGGAMVSDVPHQLRLMMLDSGARPQPSPGEALNKAVGGRFETRLAVLFRQVIIDDLP